VSLALVLAYAALVLIAVLALLWSPWPRWLKAGLALGATLLYFFGHEAVHGLLGVASRDALPENFVVVAAMVEEPSAQNHGALYLWVRPLHDGVAEAEPRAYRLAYTRKLHEQINEGLKKGRDGVSQMGTAEVRGGRARGVGGWLQPGADEQEVRIRDLPVPQLPEK
jgi:hypothetical protein